MGNLRLKPYLDLDVLSDRMDTDGIAVRRGPSTFRMVVSTLLSGLATVASLAVLAARVTALENSGGGGGVVPPAGDLTVRLGTSDDAVATGAELTVEAVAGVGLILAYAGEKHLLIGRLASEPLISSVLFSDDQSNTNQVGAFAKAADPVDRGGDDYDVWVSHQLLSQSADLIVTVR